MSSGASTWTPTTWPIWQSRMAPVAAHPIFLSSMSRCSDCYTLFHILLILSTFLVCCNDSNGDTGYFNSLFTLLLHKSPSVLDNESIFTAFFFRIFAILLPSSSSSWAVTTMVMVILASSIHCFTLLLHYKSICFG